MAEYTELVCDSPNTAEAVATYLLEQLASEEPDDRPHIGVHVEGKSLHIAYGDDVFLHERRQWDMALMGYRDGLAKKCQTVWDEAIRAARSAFDKQHGDSQSYHVNTMVNAGAMERRVVAALAAARK